ncbi:MAG TPA: Ni/Fe hydrogenase subunit alpha [Candidatus Eremiobacteraeota bacterium]|nr:Ni/Fe hydrogenase subunit alpha [Candidatus Eremiobacteraeota bacterium]
MTQTIKVPVVTRIEGHATISVDLDDAGKVKDATMHVIELRGFEKNLIGMEMSKMPQMTARICGVCPTSHLITSGKALDMAYGLTPPPAGKMLRELMNLSQAIFSHALHFFALGGPDLILGIDSPPEKRNLFGIVEAAPAEAKKALRLRTLGSKMNEILTGRFTHGIAVVAGGVCYVLEEDKRKQLLEYAKEALELSKWAMEFGKTVMQGKDPKDLMSIMDLECYNVGTVNQGKLDLTYGTIRVMDPKGNIVQDFETKDWKKYLKENARPDTYIKGTMFEHNGELKLTRGNSLARLNVCDAMPTPLAQKELELFRKNYGRPAHKSILHHYARLIEMIYACERAIELLQNPEITSKNVRDPIKGLPGIGIGHVEAPRGTLIHEYEGDKHGRVKYANFMVATQLNYFAINETIKQAAIHYIEKSDKKCLNALEVAIRLYDPCLSCSTHALPGQMPLVLNIYQGGKLIRKVEREL